MSHDLIVIVAVFASVFLQLAAALMALNLARYTPRRWAWVLIALAAGVLAGRQYMVLLSLLRERQPALPSAAASGLLVAALLTAGIGGILPFFRSTLLVSEERRRVRDEMQAQAARTAEAREALAREHGLIKTLVEQIPDAVYVKDLEGRFVLANPVVAAIMGAERPEDLLGRTDFDFYPRELAERYRADEREVVERRRALVNREEERRGPDGRSVVILTTKIPFCDAAGRSEGIIGVSRDITVRREAERELEMHRRNLEELVRRRTADLEEARRAAEAALVESKRAEEELKRRAVELETFNRTMVDREMRIIEMKEEVNRLCDRLGVAPSYPEIWKGRASAGREDRHE